MTIDKDEVNVRFTYHPPHGDQADRYEDIRTHARRLAHRLVKHAPDSRELSLALTHLEEVVMWANAAIARREPHHDHDAEADDKPS